MRAELPDSGTERSSTQDTAGIAVEWRNGRQDDRPKSRQCRTGLGIPGMARFDARMRATFGEIVMAVGSAIPTSFRDDVLDQGLAIKTENLAKSFAVGAEG